EGEGAKNVHVRDSRVWLVKGITGVSRQGRSALPSSRSFDCVAARHEKTPRLPGRSCSRMRMCRYAAAFSADPSITGCSDACAEVEIGIERGFFASGI